MVTHIVQRLEQFHQIDEECRTLHRSATQTLHGPSIVKCLNDYNQLMDTRMGLFNELLVLRAFHPEDYLIAKLKANG